jgi:hypothetical protein
MPRKTKNDTAPSGGVWDTVLGILRAAGAVEDRARKSLDRHKKVFQAWMVRTAVTGLSIFMCLAFLVLGVFFVAIDYGGVPRGVVFICGGLLGLLLIKLLVRSPE